MMDCIRVQHAIDRWTAEGDLDDAVVEHLDRCAVCRRAFDQAFPSPLPNSSPNRLGSTVGVPDAGGAAWVRTVGLMAAVVLLSVTVWELVPSGSPGVHSVVELGECPAELWQPPECPT